MTVLSKLAEIYGNESKVSSKAQSAGGAGERRPARTSDINKAVNNLGDVGKAYAFYVNYYNGQENIPLEVLLALYPPVEDKD